MPNNVYQPKCTRSASSKEMNLHQASRDTLGLYRHHPKSPTVSSMLSTTSRTFTSQDPTDDPSGKPMGVRRTYVEDHAFLITSAPHSPFVCNHPTLHRGRRAILATMATWLPTDVVSMAHAPIATAFAAMVGCTASPLRIRSIPHPPTSSSETPMASIFIPSSKTFCQSRPA